MSRGKVDNNGKMSWKMQQGSDLIWDDEAHGLCVRVYPDGAKSFIFLYHINGRQRFIRIGCSPGLSLKAARNRARELRRIVDEGCDPVGNERDRRWITSFEKFLRHVAETRRRKQSNNLARPPLPTTVDD